ncbi:DNA-processing protein DprA [Chloroflexus sp. Y-396-1]|uniref:DNA-processing protein DprA n=1 Tax=Chloroflexus sp. Y-396-1 TaxID=867845 RepID=UPI00048D17DE|nr:DNA-processing protein DprA [Chloroflexus sp. Y-396-1]
MEDVVRYYVGFNLVPGIGPLRLARLIERCGSIAAAWHADETMMIAAGLDARSMAGLQEARRRIDLDAELERLRAVGVTPISIADPRYPPLLRMIPAPPPLLYLCGTLTPADQRAVAIVGTRHPSHYGREAARRLARDLASAGMTIVSGLALGIDTIAHTAALEAGGRTIAVLASGIDRVYPERNRALAERIKTSGALLSDYPLGTPPAPLNFPPRNRIISGLSLATLVVEAGESSGALITVQFALDQGREVMAVPGSIFNPLSAGPHRLIRDGAAIVTGADDVLAVLNLDRQTTLADTPLDVALTPEEEAIYAVVMAEPQHIDMIGRAAGQSAAATAAALALLELKGLVRQVAPLYYARGR